VSFTTQGDTAAFYQPFKMRYGKEDVTWANPVERGIFADTYSYTVMADVLYRSS
jgi:hypothetical protein